VGVEIFGDDEIYVSNFRFVPYIFWGAILLPMSKRAPPNGRYAPAATFA